jgi:hypothetical protein
METMKLWDKEISTEQGILAFTTGKDPLYDLDLLNWSSSTAKLWRENWYWNPEWRIFILRWKWS